MNIITVNELSKKLESRQVTLIDVREPAEYRAEYIEAATLMPLAEISADKLPAKSDCFVIYCRSGKRSQEACKKLLAQKPGLELYSLEGGILAWKNAGFATRSLGRPILPLDRQTQVAVGLLNLSGIMMGTFGHPAFYTLSGFVGLGLIFAGITGWCGMAKLLAKMPWNQ